MSLTRSLWFGSALWLTLSLIGCGKAKAPVADAPNNSPPAVPAQATDSAPAADAASMTDATAPASEAPVEVAGTMPADKPAPSAPVNPPSTTPAGAGTSPVATPAATPAGGVAAANAERHQRLEKLLANREQNVAPGNSLKQIGLALHNFYDVNDVLPGNDSDGSGDSATGLSWRVHLLPYLGEAELYDEFQLDEPWDSEHNKTLIAKMPQAYGKHDAGKTRYQVFAGEGTPFPSGKGLTFPDVIDGLSNTLAVVIAGEDVADVWTKPGGLPFNAEKPAAALGKVGDEVWVLWLDGSASKISTKAESLALMIQHADGQMLAEEDRGFSRKTAPTRTAAEPAAIPPLAERAPTIRQDGIPSDTLLVISGQPRRVIEHPLFDQLFEAVNHQQQSKADFVWGMLPPDMREDLEPAGVSPPLIEEFRICFGSEILQFDPFDGQPPAFVLSLRFAAPIDEERLSQIFIDKSWGELELQVSGGVSYVVEPEQGTAFGFPSDREFVIGQQAMVAAALDPAKHAQPDSPLLQQLTSTGNPMLVLAGVMTPEVRAQAQALSQQVPPPVMLFMPYVTQLASLSIQTDLEQPQLLAIETRFQKPELAAGLGAILEGQLGLARDQFTEMKPAMADSEMAPALPLLTELVDGLKLTTEGNRVSLVAPRPENLNDLPKLLAPAIEHQQRVEAERQLRNNLKQIGLAIHNYHDTFNHMPALDGVGHDPAKAVGLSWRVWILPFLDEAPLYNEFHLDEPWDSEHNKALIPRMPKIFGENAEGKTSIHVVTGEGTPFQKGKGLRFQQITDGLSNTILAVEAADDTAEIWTKPTGLTLDLKDPLKCLGKFPEEQTAFRVLLMDGSVRNMSRMIDGEIFRKLVQHQDGEDLGDF